ncbi:PREDICTED: two-component response regulator-like APRR5 isoform X2 [Tarenaya hassleriana]|nr:PREDICTED: two-component response regulator-like APRR5 isoform X2 [Tarenaya hassleriana]
MLRGRPESVDLILTEVDLPSISGYALLTLIMEHETCKNIPVIMMSTQNSVSTVYKCMLRGAVDYLVKPLRRNELRNLWQHVWRRQRSFAGGDLQPDESVGQRKVEATPENNSTSNNGNAIARDERPITGKRSDAQSSCTRPDLEDESPDVDKNPRDLLQKKIGKSLLNDTQVPENEAHDGTRGVENKAGDKSDSCKAASDFMEVPFRRNGECNGERSSRLELDLSLRRSNASENASSAEQPSLWPSSASAFTRYVHRSLQMHSPISPAFPNQSQCAVENQDGKSPSETATFDRSKSSEPTPSGLRNYQTTFCARANAPEPPPPPPRVGTNPWLRAPIPVKGIWFGSQSSGYTSALVPVLIAQSNPSPTPSPGCSVSPQEYSSRFHSLPRSNLENGIPECSQARDGYVNHSSMMSNPVAERLDSGEERRYVSSGSTSNADQQLDKKSRDGFPTPDGGTTRRSHQREAALTKFRMKRKDRCFEKKVRYESRKKLAEQRPRVKGQFVRQARVSEPSTSTSTRDPNAAPAQDNPS